jgi:hypothetical protein
MLGTIASVLLPDGIKKGVVGGLEHRIEGFILYHKPDTRRTRQSRNASGRPEAVGKCFSCMHCNGCGRTQPALQNGIKVFRVMSALGRGCVKTIGGLNKHRKLPDLGALVELTHQSNYF